MYRFLWAYFQFSGVHARAELLGQMEALTFNFLMTSQSDFQRGCCTTYLPTGSAWGWFLRVLASVSYPPADPAITVDCGGMPLWF